MPRSPRGDALGDTLREAQALRRAHVGVVVVDAEPPGRAAPRSCARQLAEAAGGVYLELAELSPDVFADALESVA